MAITDRIRGWTAGLLTAAASFGAISPDQVYAQTQPAATTTAININDFTIQNPTILPNLWILKGREAKAFGGFSGNPSEQAVRDKSKTDFTAAVEQMPKFVEYVQVGNDVVRYASDDKVSPKDGANTTVKNVTVTTNPADVYRLATQDVRWLDAIIAVANTDANGLRVIETTSGKSFLPVNGNVTLEKMKTTEGAEAVAKLGALRRDASAAAIIAQRAMERDASGRVTSGNNGGNGGTTTPLPNVQINNNGNTNGAAQTTTPTAIDLNAITRMQPQAGLATALPILTQVQNDYHLFLKAFGTVTVQNSTTKESVTVYQMLENYKTSRAQELRDKHGVTDAADLAAIVRDEQMTFAANNIAPVMKRVDGLNDLQKSVLTNFVRHADVLKGGSESKYSRLDSAASDFVESIGQTVKPGAASAELTNLLGNWNVYVRQQKDPNYNPTTIAPPQTVNPALPVPGATTPNTATPNTTTTTPTPPTPTMVPPFNAKESVADIVTTIQKEFKTEYDKSVADKSIDTDKNGGISFKELRAWYETTIAGKPGMDEDVRVIGLNAKLKQYDASKALIEQGMQKGLQKAK